MNRPVAELYAPDIITLATKPDTPRIPFKHEVFEEAVKWLHKEGRYTADMLADPHAHRLIEETYNALNGAIGASITQEMPEEMTYALRNNAFIFSGFKTHRTLSEVGLELTDEEGNLKPYTKFLEDVKRIDSKYNDTYLYAEYNHAVHATQMAVKWQDFVRDGDDYNLQYRTAGDERVREAHIALDGVTLPPSDKFWDRYLPPNGWNCRCTVVQVLREDFPLSDSEEATKRGDESTQSIKQQMFRFNPGKTLEVFPPKHPYLPKGCGSCPQRASLKLATPVDRGLPMCVACGEIAKQCRTEQKRVIDEWKERKIPVQGGLPIIGENFATGELRITRGSVRGVLDHTLNIAVRNSLLGIERNALSWEYVGWQPVKLSSDGKPKHAKAACFIYYKMEIGGKTYYASVEGRKDLKKEALYCIRENCDWGNMKYGAPPSIDEW